MSKNKNSINLTNIIAIFAVALTLVGAVIYYIQYDENKDAENRERISKLEGQMEMLLQERSYNKSKDIK